MAQRKGIFLTQARTHKALWMAMAASFALHFLLLLPNNRLPSRPLQTDKTPVIFAELRQEKPQQAQLQQGKIEAAKKTLAAEQVATTQTAPKVTTTKEIKTEERVTTQKANKSVSKKNNNQPQTQQSTVQAKQPPAPVQATAEGSASSRSGLTISDDLLSSDPLERSYQKTLLAHLRNNLSVPQHLDGKVRLEVQFRYRQIATQVHVIQSSGDPELDDWALKAVLSANPFPPIPADLPDGYIFRPTLRTAP